MHVIQLLAQIGVILAAGRLLARLVRRFGQPTVIAETLAGILLGPSLLGVVWPSALTTLFPAASLPQLGMTAQLGLVFFMFLIGLEFDPGLLRGRGRASVAISAAGIVVPFVLGILLSMRLYPTLAPAGVSPGAFGLFLGAAMSVTAFPVLARILAERGLVRTRVGTLALAAAAVNDVTAWCMLAFVVAVASASGTVPAIRTSALAVGYILLMWRVVRPMIGRVGPRAGQALSSDMVAFVFLLLLGSAAITEWIGIHALFGAFVLGAVIPRERGLHAILVEKIEDFVTIVLLPLFFAYSGLRTQIGLLSGADAWAQTGWIVLVACLGKFGGTALAARLAGLDGRTSAAVGILMNTRGLVELVMLNIGLDLGVISPALFAMMVVMALVTTVATSPLLERIYPASQMLGDEAPRPAAPEPGVLLCLSDPGIAAAMLQIAAAWTRRGRAAVWALHLRPVERLSESMSEGESAEDPLDAVTRCAAEVDLAVEPLSFPSATPGEDIARVARARGVPLVIIGIHRSALRGESFGGATSPILRDAPADVGVLVDRGLQRITRVGLVAGTGPHAEAAARIAARLEHEGGAEIVRIAGADASEGVDLVVAPVTLRRSIPDRGTASWLLVHARSGGSAYASATGPLPRSSDSATRNRASPD